ncbi:MAG TPA: alpha-glucan family phosphorylase [Stellaceae bacterium]|nr:alpha-glucan family phosphorylase [Stellaceae bacterium]
MPALPTRDFPTGLQALGELALDLRWTWSHEADALWERVDAEAWSRTRNPWVILQDISAERLRALAADSSFVAELERLAGTRRAYLDTPGWFSSAYGAAALSGVAYFSMEFGLGEGLPLYAGGLGILAGDFLKTASDLGIPVIGVGLLYQEGYFRQIIDAAGVQHEAYPFNDPGSLPIELAQGQDGAWLRVALDLPGRTVSLRVWQALVGRIKLYLLDANDPLNSPADRGITGKLYDAGSEIRISQEVVLGVAGWRAVEALAPEVEICHLNEGHAAFAVLERARAYMRRSGLSFREALWATRAGNLFTTHTPVEAGFDRFPADALAKYARYVEGFLAEAGIGLDEFLALGRARSDDENEPFNMAYLAMRGSMLTFGVSRLHGQVSRRIFQPLFPRWPEVEVPIGHVTNGVHVPSWDSPGADDLWTAACGKERWRGVPDALPDLVASLSDEELWVMAGEERQTLIQQVRTRLARQLGSRGYPPEIVAQSANVLDPNALTVGFARRFTGYKRPNLLLADRARLARLLNDPARPVQLVLAGKAHPADDEGKEMIREWIGLAQGPEFRQRIVFLEDYDIALAQELVQGVDVWINTPRRPWEACGTSGMKVLVNGGLNLSERDGWWAEAYAPEFGWAIGDGRARTEGEGDAEDAEALYAILEQEVVPEFYARDAAGMPRRWLERVRRSMASLTPTYSSSRMARDYVGQYYLAGAAELRRRTADRGEPARAMHAWESRLRRHWSGLHIGETSLSRDGKSWSLSVPVYLGEIAPADVAVQLYADPRNGEPPFLGELLRREAIIGATNGHIFAGTAPATRSAEVYTVRIVPHFPGVRVPVELSLILWQK